MVDQDKKRPHGRDGISYAARKEGLREQMPESWHKAKSPRQPFENARDPWLRKQREADKQSEAQRRESGDGSKMVKLHKPFPELRPKRERSQIRHSFNRAWLREDREARERQFDAQAEKMRQETSQDLDQYHTRSNPRIERSR